MEQYGDMMSGAGVVVYIVIGLFVLLCAWWGYKLYKNNRGNKPQTNSDLPSDDYQQISQEIKPPEAKGGIRIGPGLPHKCVCFRTIKGVNVADFTNISDPVGELYQLDPSCPASGNGYIVKQEKDGTIVDYDPRQLKFEIKKSPEYAWFAINWDICKSVFFVPVQWWKSTSVWFAAAMLVITFVSTLALLG